MFRNSFCCRTLKTESFSSFEVLLVQLNNTQSVVYRLKPHMNFSKEFSNFLVEAVLKYNRLFIVGDFNIHVCCKLNSLAKDFISLVNSFDFTQVVNGPTHKHDHTLDLVLLTRF